MTIQHLFYQLLIASLIFFSLINRQVQPWPIVELCLTLILTNGYQLLHSFRPKPRTDFKLLEIATLVSFAIGTYFFPSLFDFTPCLFFVLTLKNKKQWWALLLIPFWGYIINYPPFIIFQCLFLAIMTAAFHNLLVNTKKISDRSYQEIDRLRDLNFRIKKDQQELIDLQDQRVQSSILDERRRIVEEIHDLLGHQISSVVIQIGALEYLVEDLKIRQPLQEMRQILNTSMDNVRSVIHMERARSIDLQTELQALVDQFNKCPIHFTYQNQTPLSNQAIHSILNIVKEGLTNINKHAQATNVTLSFQESDQWWQLLIADNGVNAQVNPDKTGIGLLTIEERVLQLSGQIFLSLENGFRLFIKLPKEHNHEANHN